MPTARRRPVEVTADRIEHHLNDEALALRGPELEALREAMRVLRRASERSDD